MQNIEETYLQLKERQQAEFNAFPIRFAFNKEQFDIAMQELGLFPTQTDHIYTLAGTGGYYKRTDAPALHEMLGRHVDELWGAINSDKSGEGFILEMFRYELANHEYCITWDTKPALRALGLEWEQVKRHKKLMHGLKLARIEVRELA